jgi:hypothetical protein
MKKKENRWQAIFGPQVIVFQPCYIEGDSQTLDLNSRAATYQISGLGYAPLQKMTIMPFLLIMRLENVKMPNK